MEVSDLEGRTWSVRRRWLPAYADTARARWRWSRIRGRASGAAEVADLPLVGELDLIWVALALVILVVVLFVALPLVLDAIVVTLAVLLGGLVRTVLRRPWTVEARRDDGTRLTRPVVGWLASGRAAAAWADELRHGRGQEGGADGAGLLA